MRIDTDSHCPRQADPGLEQKTFLPIARLQTGAGAHTMQAGTHLPDALQAGAGKTRALRASRGGRPPRSTPDHADGKQHLPRARGTGKVFLVGAGPGDPELLTVKAMRLICGADAVVYDHLVGEAVVALIPAGARRVYAGKEAGNHALPQHEINGLLVRLAREGHDVVRLKGGDPFIFGRGGEEMQAVQAAGIRCEIVPGITAAAGAASCTGIPLTHREHAQTLVFATGHLKDGTVDLDWPALARPPGDGLEVPVPRHQEVRLHRRRHRLGARGAELPDLRPPQFLEDDLPGRDLVPRQHLPRQVGAEPAGEERGDEHVGVEEDPRAHLRRGTGPRPRP